MIAMILWSLALQGSVQLEVAAQLLSLWSKVGSKELSIPKSLIVRSSHNRYYLPFTPAHGTGFADLHVWTVDPWSLYLVIGSVISVQCFSECLPVVTK